MAYSGRFNPDALPAHAEPNEAAQIIANAQAAKTKTSPNLQPMKSSPSPNLKPMNMSSSYGNKPPPPLPGSPTQQQSSFRPYSVGSASVAGPPKQMFRPHSTNIVEQPHHSNASPTTNPSHWPAPLNTNPQIVGAYPASTGAQTVSPNPLGIQRSHSPLPPAGTQDPSLWPLFIAVDINRNGQLTQAELSNALKNDEYTSFDPETVRMMIKMFDTDGNGIIGYEGFCGLWGFLGAWRTLFQRFDEDRSGYISFTEYSNALTAFGYNLSPDFVMMMYRIYDRRRDERMTFDLFVQSCIQLKRMTDIFKKYDTDRDGFITLSFENFLTEILNVR